MAAMKETTAADRCNARVQRLVQVKFIALPIEHTPPSETDRPRMARHLEWLRDLLTRAASCLEAARP